MEISPSLSSGSMLEGTGAVWEAMAVHLWSKGEVREAEAAARKGLALDAHLERASLIVGSALGLRSQYKEAALHFARAVEENPQSFAGWQALGKALGSTGEHVRAEYCYRRALELDPTSSEVRIDLASLLSILAREEEARQELRAAQAHGSPAVQLRLAQAITPLPESEEQILAERAQMLADVKRLSRTIRPAEHLKEGDIATNFWLAYHGLNDRELQEQWAGLVLKTYPVLGKVHTRRKPRQGRLRVGFISAFLRNSHTISKLTMGLMGTLPRDRFEVIACDVAGSANDPGYLPRFADRVVPVSPDGLGGQSELASLELDIAFFTDIGMSPTTWQMALGRVAPVQCTTWGHPVTSGFPSIDYFISSSLIEPDGASEHYSEKLVQLSTLPTYYYPPARTSKQTPSLPEGWTIYLCPQTLFKLHPAFDEVFAEILRRDPKGHLLLIDLDGQYGNKLGDRLASGHPDIIDRVEFLNRMPMDQFMGLTAACHVMLDTHPFSGGNTNYEAFAFAAPVVTLPGDYMRGRVTAGQYRKMGFTDLIASSKEDYIEKALRVGTDADYRGHVRHTISSRHRVLYEDITATHELAAFFERACKEAR